MKNIVNAYGQNIVILSMDFGKGALAEEKELISQVFYAEIILRPELEDIWKISHSKDFPNYDI